MSTTDHAIPDYLTIPRAVRESFHSRVGQLHGSNAPDKKPPYAYGYPIPGMQSPSAQSVMAEDYFVSDLTWEHILDHGDFDFIVIGSGCTALAFIKETLTLDPTKRILCLERGDFWLPSHFQNLPLPFKMVLGGPSETFPFTLSLKTHKSSLGFVHGSCPFFGGRSTFWSAWSPQPTVELMRDFPPSMIEATHHHRFWHKARHLLNVTSAANIDDNVFAGLQDKVDEKLKLPINQHVPSADISEPAQLAVGRRSPTSTLRFNKFSTPGPMLGIFEEQKAKAKQGKGAPLELMVNCAAVKMRRSDDGYVRVLETSRGALAWSDKKTKVILCAGAFPAATMLINSFPECRDTVGKGLTGHFLSHVTARIPIDCFGEWKPHNNNLQIAAHYVAGLDPQTNKQYHIQITAIHSPHPKQDAEDAARECPDYAAAATYNQLEGSEQYVVIVCATLGEFEERNPNNWMKHNSSEDPTANVTLQYLLSENDKKLRHTMDDATFQTIELLGGEGNQEAIQYWDEPNECWVERAKINIKDIHIKGVVHEASTAYMGPKEKGGSLDDMYRPHGIQNVYVTGAAAFPTAGSWNPTMTMCGFAQDLARKLHEEPQPIDSDPED